MEGMCFHAALADFKTALSARNIDNRRLSTYGAMHFIRYFPHRESGLCYFLLSFQAKEPLSLLIKAREEIQKSLSQDATVKARVWKALIEQRILQIQTTIISRPVITIKSVNNCSWVSGETVVSKCRKIAVSGEAADPGFVSEISLNGEPVFLSDAQQLILFNKQLLLKEGFNYVNIFAKNLLQGVTDIQIPVLVDTLGPQIRILSIDSYGCITGRISDQGTSVMSVIAQFQSDRRDIEINESGLFHFDVHPEQLDGNILIMAEDYAGNISRILINQQLLQRQSAFSCYLVSAENNMISDGYTVPKNSAPSKPEILFLGWPDFETVYVDKVDIQGQIISQSGIKKFTIYINDQLKDCNNNNYTDAFMVNFDCTVDLLPGDNYFRAVITDRWNQHQTRQLKIERHIPDIEKISNRYALKTIDFDLQAHPIYDAILNKYQTQKYSKYLSADKRIFFQKALLKNIREQGRFNIQSKEDQPFNAIVLGNTTLTNEGIEVDMRIVSIKDRKILGEFDSYTTNCTVDGLKFVANHLCKQIHRALKRFQGTIREIVGNRFVVSKDFADNSSVIFDWPLIIYQPGEERFNPITHISLGAGTNIMGFGKIIGKHNNPFNLIGASSYYPTTGLKVTNK
jgi:hypothetical protein